MPSEETQFRKGQGGRPPGAVNKTTKLVKEVFADVFQSLQDDENHKAHLKTWAKNNPTEFYRLASKLIPIQIGGDPENPVPVNITEGLSFEQLMKLKYGPDYKP